MKRLVTLLIMFNFYMTIIASSEAGDNNSHNEIDLVEINSDGDLDEEEHRPHKSQFLFPHVFYNGNVVQISSVQDINNVVVVLRDNSGNVIYFTIIPALSGVYSITLPVSVIEEVYSIELLYQSHHLIGYF